MALRPLRCSKTERRRCFHHYTHILHVVTIRTRHNSRWCIFHSATSVMAPSLAAIMVGICSLRVVGTRTRSKVNTCANSFMSSIWLNFKRCSEHSFKAYGIRGTVILVTWGVSSWAWYFAVCSHRTSQFLPNNVLWTFTNFRAEIVDARTWCL